MWPDRLYGTPGSFEVYVCRACGTGRTMPTVASEDLGGLYPGTYDAHRLPGNPVLRGLATPFPPALRTALNASPLGALRATQPGRLLDVGSGRGDLGVVLGEQGWDVTGSSPRRRDVEKRDSGGVRSVQGTPHDERGRTDR